MPRTYQNKGIHGRPENAGEQNLPPNYVDTRKDDTGTVEATAPLFSISLDKAKRYKGQYTPELLAQELEEYVKYVNATGLKPSKASVRLWLGISKDTYWDWETNPTKYGDKTDLIRQVNDFIESSYIGRVEQYPTGNIFLLKTSHGHIESSKVDITSGGKSLQNPDNIEDTISKLGLDK